MVIFCETLNKHSPRGVLGLEETWLRQMSSSNSLMFPCNWELQWSGSFKVTWPASGRAGVTEIKPWDCTKGSYPTTMPRVWQRTPSFLVFALESWLSTLKGVKGSELRAGAAIQLGVHMLEVGQWESRRPPLFHVSQVLLRGATWLLGGPAFVTSLGCDVGKAGRARLPGDFLLCHGNCSDLAVARALAWARNGL